jgi:hypothetical protein
MRVRSRNIAWLIITGVLSGLAFISGASVEAMTAVAGLYGVALAGSLLEFQPQRLRMTASPLTRMRMSTDAREAVDRARRRGASLTGDLTLIDVGLISSQSSDEGMVMRKGRTISGDDDGVRPFITLYVNPSEADRSATIRFEILDQNGQRQYIHEMKTFLRDGEMNILADHHLPLFGNDQLKGGDWDLRVTVDGLLAGILSFSVTPSVRDRLILRNDQQERQNRLEDKQDDAPLTLEELLRSQQEGRRTRK